ncbi:hypothetical protein [Cohnella silvisoli]|uniref:Uncharacterized protein n=1 Tax=Cohnella silvisoli TaxID=2873699 RepID=A0ABV1KSR6_9BACL|nr:hypothetical protein [Cohnella silvisoli]MCD9022642.1 hypothetical protein [Cohnella silvisoli]
MLRIAGILAVAGFIVALEIPGLMKKKQKRELWAFSILLMLGVGFGMISILLNNVPSPLSGITFVFKPLSDILSGIGLIK